MPLKGECYYLNKEETVDRKITVKCPENTSHCPKNIAIKAHYDWPLVTPPASYQSPPTQYFNHTKLGVQLL